MKKRYETGKSTNHDNTRDIQVLKKPSFRNLLFVLIAISVAISDQ